MTRIRTSCPTCGQVELTPDQIELTIVGAGLEDVGRGSQYRFACPGCATTVAKPADRRVARLLVEGGVIVANAGPDGDPRGLRAALHELRLLRKHPEDPPLLGPLTPDMLVDFRRLLDRDDWYEHLLAARGAAER